MAIILAAVAGAGPANAAAARTAPAETFWVLMRDKTDFGPARAAPTRAARARAVVQAARAGARAHQAGLRELLTDRGAPFETYWIADTVKVTGDAKLRRRIAARPDVKAIVADTPVVLPAPLAGTTRAGVQGNEWNIDRIGAPRVWAERGDTGRGLVIANVDTGVQFDHPALAGAYRGRQPDGTYRHDYNWYDPTHTCPGDAPCDNAGHGTHTMGTMVGADGIGVAPGATWIAAKGCESMSCSASALLAAGQWIVAPTDLSGANPRPDLAPDIVNNSWGGASGFDPWYSDVVRAWTAAGIFTAFANGNSGPGCATATTPGSYTGVYSSGAFDVNDAIAPFSSRGTGQDGGTKPDLAAPGVDVRSSVPTGGYASYSGTSMASPHTAATVALIWAAAPALRRDVAATREILDVTAADAADTSCGGTAADNNVFGEGRLDAWAAVSLATTATGTLAGTVTGTGGPVGGATITVTGPASRTATSSADGGYRFGRLPAGSYELRVTAFGYDTHRAGVTVAADATVSADVPLTASAAGIVSGTVRIGGVPAPGASVALAGTPVAVTTDAGGVFRLAAPHGDYQLTVAPLGGCAAAASRSITVSGDLTADFALASTRDAWGYGCTPAEEPYRAGVTRLDLSGDDGAAEVTLPFAMPFYGTVHDHAWVSTNGVIGFAQETYAYGNTALPDAAIPNDALYPFWDDLYVDDAAGVYTAADADTFVVEWRGVRFFGDETQRLSISAILHRDGRVTYRYRDLHGERTGGNSATIGIENADGTVGLAYSYAQSSLAEGLGLTFHPGTPNRIAAVFNVHRETVWGQQVYVAGNVAELGGWDPAKALPLTADGYPTWSGSASLPPDTAVEFKYLIRNPDGSVEWETGPNRTTTTPHTGQYVTHDDFR
ncbi:S8 family serine peptidase [Actinoplanes sp. L3-i22]|uniref:S8 family serine peptidase n=1 Tax=Actinoplanes sp. L3-i22 TaxID=2836373 RepID=UPI001C78D5FC|nr:S8 family serine peptidase [Actinoplanes sp. L3-i22]BCY13000.1 peptidase S8 [Actinoplanes sp. L3-i22]